MPGEYYQTHNFTIKPEELSKRNIVWTNGASNEGRDSYGEYPTTFDFLAAQRILRDIFPTLNMYIDNDRPLRILDIGCGNGLTTAPLISLIRALGLQVELLGGVDLLEKSANEFITNVKPLQIAQIDSVQTDVVKLLPELSSLELNTVFMFYFLHWLSEPRAHQLFQQLRSVLQPGALVFGTTCSPFNLALLGFVEEQWVKFAAAKSAFKHNRPFVSGPRGSRYNKTMTFWSPTAIRHLLKSTGFSPHTVSTFKNPNWINQYGDHFPENVFFSAILLPR